MILGNSKAFVSKTIEGEDYSNKHISSKEFDNCTFIGCNFTGAVLQRCSFTDCEFHKCNLSLTKLEYSKFSDILFRESKLVGVDWTKVAWSRLISNAPISFYNSIINDSSFFGLSLQYLVVESCVAHNVDFREGDFSNANFQSTDFKESLFSETNLSKANFSNATEFNIDIFRNTLSNAKFDRFEAIRLLGALEIELV